MTYILYYCIFLPMFTLQTRFSLSLCPLSNCRVLKDASKKENSGLRTQVEALMTQINNLQAKVGGTIVS